MYNALIGAGPNVTGGWVHMEPSRSVDFPSSVWFVPHGWTTGNVILETLLGGLPGNGGNSPYPPQADTGSVQLLITVPAPGSAVVTITDPIDYIRARTDSGVNGTVDVFVAVNS